MMSQGELRRLFAMRDSLALCPSLNVLLDTSVRLAQRRTRSQAASIFLFSKDGRLERRALIGVDRNGQPIANDWFSEESYDIGASFTGKIMMAMDGSRFGTPRCAYRLKRDEVDFRSFDKYREKLGSVSAIAAVPLNGTTRTYGVLEVINRMTTAPAVKNRMFQRGDLYQLSLLGISTAAAASILRLKDQLALHSQISHTITRPLLENEDPQTSYEQIARELTGPFTSYKACIIRLGGSPNMLEITARGGDKITWESRIEPPANPSNLYGQVLLTGQSTQVDDIEGEAHKFSNIAWIRANRLRSYACFPLKLKNRVVGALSVYAGYPSAFEADDIASLENICFLLASLAESFHMAGALRLEDAVFEKEHEHILSAARAVGYDQVLTEMRHNHKRVLQDLGINLRQVRGEISGKAARVIDDQLRLIDGEVNSVVEQFARSHSKVSIDHIVQSVAKYFSRQLRNKHIQISFQRDNVPDIEASEAELRDVIVNLLSNAIKAIEAANQKHGEIAINTRVTASQTIEIEVVDNGSGVRNEDKELIFEPGFTKYEGGTGMGLFVAKKIIESYDGKLNVDSTVGKGSKFTVRLPLTRLRWDE